MLTLSKLNMLRVDEFTEFGGVDLFKHNSEAYPEFAMVRIAEPRAVAAHPLHHGIAAFHRCRNPLSLNTAFTTTLLWKTTGKATRSSQPLSLDGPWMMQRTAAACSAATTITCHRPGARWIGEITRRASGYCAALLAAAQAGAPPRNGRGQRALRLCHLTSGSALRNSCENRRSLSRTSSTTLPRCTLQPAARSRNTPSRNTCRWYKN